MDNSANAHICREKSYFTGEIVPVPPESAGVATIGEQVLHPTGIGTAEWTWSDDDGVKHTMELQKVLYFLESPVNILSVTGLANQLQDSEGTSVRTHHFYSIFIWDDWKYQCRIDHSCNQLAELPINEGFSLFNLFAKTVNSFMKPPPKFNIFTTVNVPEVEQHTISVGDNSRYIREGRNAIVKVVRVIRPDSVFPEYEVEFPNEDTLVTSEEFL